MQIKEVKKNYWKITRSDGQTMFGTTKLLNEEMIKKCLIDNTEISNREIENICEIIESVEMKKINLQTKYNLDINTLINLEKAIKDRLLEGIV